MLAFDVKTWIPEDLMMKADKILMAHSLEGRFPFLDNDLFAYAAQLPPEYKLAKNGETKWILKELMKGQLPSKVIGRKKMGFTVPIEALLEELKPAVMATFDKISGSELDPVLKTGEIRHLVSRYYGGDKSVSALQVWTLFVLCYWFVNVRPGLQDTRGYRLPGRRQYPRERSLDTTPEHKEMIRRRMSNKYIYGNGIEIGALHCPLWTGDRANVRYVDIAPEEDNMKKYPELKGFRFAHVDIIDEGEKLDRIPAESLDFIIANHFLEHTHNPIGTIRNHLSKLKKNSRIFYAIPIKDYTFDRERPITPWVHLLMDDSDGGASSKYGHYLEWAHMIDHVKDETKAIEHARLLMSRDERIHFHVWNTESFEEFINRVRDYLGNPFDIIDFFENYEEIIVVIQRRY
jgi:SAM-dependent methyltransferase